MKTAIVFANNGVIKVFIDNVGTIDDIEIIEQAGRMFIDMDKLFNVIGWKLDDTDELMQVYTYRRL